jgi:hypothetical protein
MPKENSRIVPVLWYILMCYGVLHIVEIYVPADTTLNFVYEEHVR